MGIGVKSEYLDLAIAMAVVFFLTSLIVSGCSEIFHWVFRIRSKFLWAFLHDLIDKSGTKALPQGRLGILRLVNRDERPRVAKDPTTPALPAGTARARSWAALTGPAQTGTAPGAPADFLHLVALALDPIAAPQLSGQTKNKQKTGISFVPATSLCQAFLEVFADVGRTRVDYALIDLTNALVHGTDPLPVIPRVVAGMPDEQRDLLSRALTDLVATWKGAGSNVAGQDEAGTTFARRVGAIPGVHVALTEGYDLEAVVKAWLASLRGGSYPGATIDETVLQLSFALVRSFPEDFARQRIDVAIATLDHSPLGPTTRRLWETALGDVDRFRAGLEQWFESEMTRLSGYYKRSIRVVLAILAVSVSLTLNIDSLQLARDLWRNPDGRATLVGQADALVESGSPSGGPPKDGPVTAPPEIVAIQKLCTPNPPRQPDMFTTTDEATKSLGEVENCVRDALNKVSGLNVIDRPIWKQQAWRHDWAKSWAWLLHTLGLVGTAVALTLGAPFWFQLIKRLTGLRGDKAPRT